MGAALENTFGKHSRFEATVLQRCCGVQLWAAASGNRFGEQLCGAALTTLQNNCFEEQQLSGAAFRGSFTDNFGEQLSVAALGRNFGRFEESQLWGNSFGDYLWGIALGNSFGQVSGLAWR